MNPESTVRTIGFTKKSAAEFFELLRKSGTKRVLDVRLNNVSQLAGFSKRDDLKYFLKEIVGIDCVHLPLLAPHRGYPRRLQEAQGGLGHLRTCIPRADEEA